MKKIAIVILTFSLFYAPGVFAQEPAPRVRIETMFKSFKPGEVERAIDAFAKNSLIRPELVDQWKSQTKTVLTLNPEKAILGFEFIQEQNVGESVKRLSYVLKLADRPLYWNFTFYKPAGSWVPLRMAFTEEP
ncbi:MAG: hypothetical protein ABIR24_00595 [Verrucomicrobiota bacterium]